ncbi:MAG: polysaccharide deacetylase family protein [Bacteroidales bacterium]
MYAVTPPWFYRVFSPQYLLCQVPTVEKVAWLTFDDGPVPEATPEVLQILSKYKVKATFFCVGDNVRKYRQIFDDVIAEGHAVGNHTYSHISGWKASPGAYYNNVMHCRDYFESKLFRPPHGRFTPGQYFLLRNDFRWVLWSALTMDYHHSVSPEQCLRNAVDNLKPGAVIVFHDSIKAREKLLYALPRFIEYAFEQGYTFALHFPLVSETVKAVVTHDNMVEHTDIEQ